MSVRVWGVAVEVVVVRGDERRRDRMRRRYRVMVMVRERDREEGNWGNPNLRKRRRGA